KINLSASFSKGGKKSVYADYYFHLQPGGKSYTGGGIWMPEAAEMKKIRQEIDYNFPEFNKIIQAAAFKKTFGELERMEGQMLVNVPKGYEKDNPAADYLKLKSWVATHSFTDESLMKSAIVNETAQILRTLQPMIAFLNRSLD